MVLLTSVLPGLIFLSGVLVNTTHGWEKIANGVVVVAFAALGVRTARLGIVACPEHLVVRDYFRTYRVRWTQIAGFELPPPYGRWRKAGLRIRLLDGQLISATLYARNLFDTGRRPARDIVRELNRLLRQNSDRTDLANPDGPARPSPN
jgi:Bacterial PH domain